MTAIANPLLWLDLETTGLGNEAHVLEVAAALTEPRPPFEPIGATPAFRSLVHPPSPDYLVPAEVVHMHAANGLWNDLARAAEERPVAHVERELLAWLGRSVGGAKVTLAGSGVASYDLRVIERVFPKLHRRLTYFTLDVAVVRRWFDACGDPLEYADESTHRAASDVERALEWARRAARERRPGQVRVCAACLQRLGDADLALHDGRRWTHYPACGASGSSRDQSGG